MDLINEVVARARAGRAVARRSRYAGDWATRFPAVNGSGLHVVQRGSLWLIPENGDPVSLRAGDAVFVPHGPPHGFSHAPAPFSSLSETGAWMPGGDAFDVEFVSCCYHLDRGQVHESLTGLPDVITLTIDGHQHPQLPVLAELLGDHADGAGSGNDIGLAAVVDLMLVHLLRAWRGLQDEQVRRRTPDPQIAHVLKAVQDEPYRAWSVRELSDRTRLSRAAFTRRFTAALNETPSAYLTRRRLEQGAHLLRHTELPLASVAEHLGYATEFSFSTAFRRHYDIAPGRFRSQHRVDQ
ncbi:AraC family transcriptional regulator [Cryptosporangium arvum]|uniref:DNA-binding domain-containing protein, AraC-type n=1 Tax=Cryptosporangium arvum DSM 44712 TaxID=927661 RepID=A0A011AJW5_9ACTN|nr:AraC family transcriptional regulator [Cryptosporangium arvum]EXG82251.1 DNA-binding domain-containing protein, AraC-type [Cryptosporangium arvum DSM 44712]